MHSHRPDPIEQAKALETRWATDPRWHGVQRDYTAAEVVKLRGSLLIRAHPGAGGGRASVAPAPDPGLRGHLRRADRGPGTQMVRAGLQALYVSGWQVAADANIASQTYPDQSLYPSSSVPALVKRLNNALIRADQIDALENRKESSGTHRWWLTPRRGSAAPSTLRADEGDDRGGSRRGPL